MGEKKEPIMRKFGSPEEMAENAKVAYQIGKVKENQIEIKLGFDISNMESVMAFDIPYTPLHSTVIIKEIPIKIEDDEDTSKIVPIDLSTTGKKFIVMVAGLNVHILQKGDIVFIKGGPVDMTGRKYRGISFLEANYYDISGILMKKEEMEERILQHDRKERLKYANVGITLTGNNGTVNPDVFPKTT